MRLWRSLLACTLLLAVGTAAESSFNPVASASEWGEKALRLVLTKGLGFNETQVERVFEKTSNILPPHEYAADLTDSNWETVLRTGAMEPLAASLSDDTVWVVIVYNLQDQLSKYFLEETDAVARDNSSAAGGSLPPNMRFARLNYMTETELVMRWWIWKTPLMVIASDNLKTLRFVKMGSIPAKQADLSHFLARREWWESAPVWRGSLAPGGSLERPLAYFGKIWATVHAKISKVPSFILMMISGALVNVALGFMHKEKPKKTNGAAASGGASSTPDAGAAKKRNGVSTVGSVKKQGDGSTKAGSLSTGAASGVEGSSGNARKRQ